MENLLFLGVPILKHITAYKHISKNIHLFISCPQTLVSGLWTYRWTTGSSPGPIPESFCVGLPVKRFSPSYVILDIQRQQGKQFLTHETELVLFVVVLENSVLPMG